jgi:hypothetical protein
VGPPLLGEFPPLAELVAPGTSKYPPGFEPPPSTIFYGGATPSHGRLEAAPGAPERGFEPRQAQKFLSAAAAPSRPHLGPPVRVLKPAGTAGSSARTLPRGVAQASPPPVVPLFKVLCTSDGSWSDLAPSCPALLDLLFANNRIVFAEACRVLRTVAREDLAAQDPLLYAAYTRDVREFIPGKGPRRSLGVLQLARRLLGTSSPASQRDRLEELYRIHVRRQSDQGVREQVQHFIHLPAVGKGKRPAIRSLLETDMKDGNWKLQSVPSLMCIVPDYGKDTGTSVSYAAKLALSPRLVEALPSDAPREMQLVGTVVESGADYACFLRTSSHSKDPVLHKPGIVVRGSKAESALQPAGRIVVALYSSTSDFDQSPPPVVILSPEPVEASGATTEGLEDPPRKERAKLLDKPPSWSVKSKASETMSPRAAPVLEVDSSDSDDDSVTVLQPPTRRLPEALVDRPRLHRSHAYERDRFSHAVMDSPYSIVKVMALVHQGLEVPGIALPPSSVLKEYAEKDYVRAGLRRLEAASPVAEPVSLSARTPPTPPIEEDPGPLVLDEPSPSSPGSVVLEEPPPGTPSPPSPDHTPPSPLAGEDPGPLVLRPPTPSPPRQAQDGAPVSPARSTGARGTSVEHVDVDHADLPLSPPLDAELQEVRTYSPTLSDFPSQGSSGEFRRSGPGPGVTHTGTMDPGSPQSSDMWDSDDDEAMAQVAFPPVSARRRGAAVPPTDSTGQAGREEALRPRTATTALEPVLEAQPAVAAIDAVSVLGTLETVEPHPLEPSTDPSLPPPPTSDQQPTHHAPKSSRRRKKKRRGQKQVAASNPHEKPTAPRSPGPPDGPQATGRPREAVKRDDVHASPGSPHAQFAAALAETAPDDGHPRERVTALRARLLTLSRGTNASGDVQTLEDIVRRGAQLANALAECPLPVGGPTKGWDFGVPQDGPRTGDCGPYAGVEAVRWVFSHFVHRLHSIGEQDPVGYFRRKAVELLRMDGLPCSLWNHLDCSVSNASCADAPLLAVDVYGEDNGHGRMEYLRRAALGVVGIKKREQRYGTITTASSKVCPLDVDELRAANLWETFLDDLARTEAESPYNQSFYMPYELVAVTYAKILMDFEAPAPWPYLISFTESELGPMLADAGLVRGNSGAFREALQAQNPFGILVSSNRNDHFVLLGVRLNSIEAGFVPREPFPQALPDGGPPEPPPGPSQPSARKTAFHGDAWEVVDEIRRPALTSTPVPAPRPPPPDRRRASLFVRFRYGLPRSFFDQPRHVALQSFLDECGSGLVLPEGTVSKFHRGGSTGAFLLTIPTPGAAQQFIHEKVAVMKADRDRYRGISIDWQRGRKLNHSFGPVPSQVLTAGLGASRAPADTQKGANGTGQTRVFVRVSKGLSKEFKAGVPHQQFQGLLTSRGLRLRMPSEMTSRLHRGGQTNAFFLVFPSAEEAAAFMTAKGPQLRARGASCRDISINWARTKAARPPRRQRQQPHAPPASSDAAVKDSVTESPTEPATRTDLADPTDQPAQPPPHEERASEPLKAPHQSRKQRRGAGAPRPNVRRDSLQAPPSAAPDEETAPDDQDTSQPALGGPLQAVCDEVLETTASAWSGGSSGGAGFTNPPAPSAKTDKSSSRPTDSLQAFNHPDLDDEDGGHPPPDTPGGDQGPEPIEEDPPRQPRA